MAPVAGVFRKPYNHWYGQRDRRNALLVASAANDLAQPLFTPVDAGQWHRYRDPLRSRPWDFQQRPRWSVPTAAAGGTLTKTDQLCQISGTSGTFGTANFTTSSFTPPSSSLLVVAVSLIENNGTTTDPLAVLTITDSLGAHLTYTSRKDAVVSPTSFPTAVRIYTAPVTTGASMTLTFGTGGRSIGVWSVSVVAFTGYDTSTPTGATGSVTKGSGFSSPPDPVDITLDASPAAESHVFAAVGIDKDTANSTPGTGWTEICDVENTTWGGMQSQDRTASTSTNVHWDDVRAGGGAIFNYAAVAVEVKAAPGGAPADIPWTPQRFVSLRDAGRSFWLQRPTLLTGLVTQVDPLPSPLDVAYGDGGALWHVYDDRRTSAGFVGQRAYYDPTLLTPAVADVPYALQRSVQVRDYGETFWTQRRSTDLTLLDTAQLEISPLPPRTMWADRREVPQQRAYVSDPTLLDTAQLEDPLLAGAPERTIQLPRTWQPQQRQTLVDQSTQPAAAFDPTLVPPRQPNPTDRRLVPQQRTYFSEPGQPLDLTVFPGWQPYQTAALHVDRREVPQQRAYISDPSFYPQPGVTDPLTLAWGDGGTYWVIYNTAALQTSRRQVPQQRQLESIPGLLDTALLEDPLLGGETLVHRMWYPDRRVAPQQLRALAAFADDADPTLLTGDRWRRYHRPAYTDRRLVPQQPARSTLYFDAGPDTPPLTLSWGAGGNLWHLYRWRRTARSWWPPRLLFGPLDDPCTILRPGTGTTSRPGSGSTSRPGSGTTTRPTSGLTARPDTGQTEDPC